MLIATLDRLRALTRIIQEICAITGTPGLSLGILHHGSVIYTENFGYRDVEAKLPPTEETIYHLGSLSKTFTSAITGALVEDGLLSFDKPIHEYLPGIQNVHDADLSENITITDLLSHRTGLAAKQDIWYQSKNRYLLEKRQTIEIFNYLEPVKPFRSEMLYNNWGFAVAGEVLETVAGSTWGDLVIQHIVEPLGLRRTFVNSSGRDDTNYAKAYMPLDNTEPVSIPRPLCQDGTLMAPANGVRSSVSDLLKLYEALLVAWDNQLVNPSSCSASPFKQLPKLLSAHIPLTDSSRLEQSYALGWVRTELPGPLGAVGYNGIFVDRPIVCKESESRLAVYHQGSLPGFTSSVHMFPETQTAIVVLTNSLGISDCADWVGQLLIETLFDCGKKNDYVDLARRSAEGHKRVYGDVEKELAEDRQLGTSPRPHSEYVGRYYNLVRDWYVEITVARVEDEERLFLSFQKYDDDLYCLEHYHTDVFTWHLTRDQAVKRGRFTFDSADYQKMKFGHNEHNHINTLTWSHDPDIPGGETFSKVSTGMASLDASKDYLQDVMAHLS